MTYNHQEIEQRWQKYWADQETFKVEVDTSRPKYYILDMFPYPSGEGLHVGHPLGYIASDIYTRYQRLRGYNVLHPMGYDSFGLPAEQYAIQTGQHPKITTQTNVKRYREQLDRMGFSYDWSKQVKTSDPDYYKWTQWIFLQLFDSWYDVAEDKAKPITTLIQLFETSGNEKVEAVCDDDVIIFSNEQWKAYTEEEKQRVLLQYRLTFLAETQTNWCRELGTVLANDEIVNGLSVRGGYPVEKKKMMQWNMRITAYAERLLSGLDNIDWSSSLKESQRYWIGKSKGAKLFFEIENTAEKIEVFTTRPDTVYGVTFLTLAPELELVREITTAEQREAVEAYIKKTSLRSELDRMSDVKTITGVFTGAYAVHPLTGVRIPIWLGDYVLANYGTGAVMAVPCGDQRDFDFAKYFDIPITNIFGNVSTLEEAYADKDDIKYVYSDILNGLSYKEAEETILKEIEKKGCGQAKINYRLRDAIFSRQRYWGEPFPIYFQNDIPHPIALEHLPLELPEVEKYLPTEDGRPPLGNSKKWAWDTEHNQVVDNDLIDHKKIFPLDLNTMPGWAGSSWYFNRYMDANNKGEFASKSHLDYWKDVDLYIGGSEHATGHLLYARFWQMFLYDRGYVSTPEFAKKLINQGMILGDSALIYKDTAQNTFYSKDQINDHEVIPIHVHVSLVNASDELDIEGFKKWLPIYNDAKMVTASNGKFVVAREVEKMSKSKYNVVNPDDICEEYGADTLRLYEMFLGPLEQAKPWNTSGITGVHSFLKKMWKLYYNDQQCIVNDDKPSAENLKTLHKTIKKIQEDIESFSFNTSVSAFMIAVNELTEQKCHSREILQPLLILLAPYAPHITEELWASSLGNKKSISWAQFPVFEASYLVEKEKEYPVSFNGKMKFKVKYPLDMSVKDIEKDILSREKTQSYLDGATPKKVIVVPNKIINIVK